MAESRKPFAHPRFATRGIVHDLEPALQLELWLMIDFLCTHPPGGGVDYLQVFDLHKSDGYLNQSITHRQERPPYSATNAVHTANPEDGRIFVIDDGCHATMMWSHEY